MNVCQVPGAFIFAVRRELAPLGELAIVHDDEMAFVRQAFEYGGNANAVAQQIAKHREPRKQRELMAGFINSLRAELREIGCDDMINLRELSLVAECLEKNDSPQFCAKWIRFYRNTKAAKLSELVKH